MFSKILKIFKKDKEITSSPTISIIAQCNTMITFRNDNKLAVNVFRDNENIAVLFPDDTIDIKHNRDELPHVTMKYI